MTTAFVRLRLLRGQIERQIPWIDRAVDVLRVVGRGQDMLRAYAQLLGRARGLNLTALRDLVERRVLENLVDDVDIGQRRVGVNTGELDLTDVAAARGDVDLAVDPIKIGAIGLPEPIDERQQIHKICGWAKDGTALLALA